MSKIRGRPATLGGRELQPRLPCQGSADGVKSSAAPPLPAPCGGRHDACLYLLLTVTTASRSLISSLLHMDCERPFRRHRLRKRGEDIVTIPPGHIDVLRLDCYAHSQWQFTGPGVGMGTSPTPGRLDDLIVEYWDRYRLPIILGETDIRGQPPIAPAGSSTRSSTMRMLQLRASRCSPIRFWPSTTG